MGAIFVYLHDGTEFTLKATLVHPYTWPSGGDGGYGGGLGSTIAIGGDVILAAVSTFGQMLSGPYGVAAYHGISNCDESDRLDLCQLIDGELEDANGDGSADVCQQTCLGDLNFDGVVNARDIVQLVHAFGPCDGCPEDLNGDGVVNPHDLRLLLDNLGPCE